MRAALPLALLVTGCVTQAPDAPAPPAAAHATPLDRARPTALDGRETFALAGQGAARFVAMVETARATLAVAQDGALVDLARPGAPVARDVLPELRASDDGRVVAFSVRSADAVADVHVVHDGRVRRLTEGLPAVVLAVSPAGDEVAFLAAAGGLPALWTVPVAGGAPRQLTNVDLVRTVGRAPDGFVPPPMRAADVRWERGALAWDAADGTWRIDARTGAVLERP